MYTLSRGPVEAKVTLTGALHSFMIDGREFLESFGGQYGAGAILFPFPNRVDGGKYHFNGDHQLAINEPERNNAIAGLVTERQWAIFNQEADWLRLATRLNGQAPGYPFEMRIIVDYKVDAPGTLTVTTQITNDGDKDAPFGVGYHPYFRLPGAEGIDTYTLMIPASEFLQVDERMIPILPPSPVTGSPYDFNTAKLIGEISLDNCFARLIPGADGYSRIKLSSKSGTPTITVFMDASFDFFQVFTSDPLPGEDSRKAVALEPMTMAPNGFNNGLGILILAPGAQHTCTWGICVDL